MAALFATKDKQMFSKILIPLDGSKLAEKVLPYATEIAQRFNADLLLVRVLQPMVVIPGNHETSSYRLDLLQSIETEATLYLKNIQKSLTAQGLSVKFDLLEGGPIAEMIIEAAVDQNIDLIVISTHGYSGSKRWVYGSVANKVLQQAPCPVFLVRAIETQGQEET